MPLRSGPGHQAQWPPRSPHDVLANTPSGRERLCRMAERTSPSPSPLKKSRSQSALTARSGNMRRDLDDDNDPDVDEDEEDEETLQLKLQAIEAKLKLKMLQRKQKKAGSGSSDAENGSFRSDTSSVSELLAASRAQSRAAMLNEGLRRPAQAEVQIPASPVRKVLTAPEQRSPSRVLLGIDKGLKAKDVSLKRAAPSRKPNEAQTSQGGYLRRAHTPAASLGSLPEVERPKTFSERLAAARTEEEDRKDKQARIRQIRNKSFTVGQEEVERYKKDAKEIPEIPLPAECFSREEIIAGGQLRQSNTVSGRKGATQDSELGTPAPTSGAGSAKDAARKKKVAPSKVPDDEAGSFEPFSGMHLSKRIVPHSLLTRTLSGKKTILIKDLLRDVKYPDFQLPEIEQDVVVFGILASKSEPRAHKPSENLREQKGRFDKEEQRGKYMVLTLVDLQYEVELFLFNTAFQRYWKMTPGTLVAILNPTIMPPIKGREHTGRFSLVINSDGDTILEVGNTRDLGFCKSVKKDGELCNSWVNKKRTEFCEFHMNTALDRKRLARQEINTGSGMGPRDKPHREKFQRNWKKEEQEKKRGNYDRSTRSHFYVSQASSATLMDNENMLQGQVAERVERGDALRRRLATQEKERDIMKQLGKIGKGAGRDYMRFGEQVKNLGSSVSLAPETSAKNDDDSGQKADAKSLGLIAPRGQGANIHLSPIKRKRTNSAFSSASGSKASGAMNSNKANTGGFGWGGSLKDKLTRMKDGEKLDGTSAAASAQPPNDGGGTKPDQQPARKKTRFVTEKGIREAGRESLGSELIRKDDNVVTLDDLDDSDDELVILK